MNTIASERSALIIPDAVIAGKIGVKIPVIVSITVARTPCFSPASFDPFEMLVFLDISLWTFATSLPIITWNCPPLLTTPRTPGVSLSVSAFAFASSGMSTL